MTILAASKIWTPDNSHLLRYRAEAEAGSIVIGQELWTELDNLAEDIRTERFIYDPESVALRFDFIENCIKLTKSPFYGKPMKLLLWQKAFIEALYGFKMPDQFTADGDPIDRFKKALLLIARKNGKSELCSADANASLIIGNPGSDIVCASNDDKQCNIIYNAIDTMRRMYDPKSIDTSKNLSRIKNDNNDTNITKISDRTENKEGRNIDTAYVDEAHEMKENVVVKSIEQSQSVKDNPKLVIITTEGFVQEGYLDGELVTARKIINGEDQSITAERCLPWLYTQDSEAEIFRNPKSWAKSNPSLGVIKKVSYLTEQVELAKESKADRIFVLAKDFNIKQNVAQSWLNLEDYDYKATYNLEDFDGAICLGHVDLAETTDLCCAKVLMMRADDNVKYIHTMYFIPESKLQRENDDHAAGAKYKEWADAGHVRVCEGNDIDLSVVADWFFELHKRHKLRLYRCGYDQKFARDWLNCMESYGWSKKDGDLEMVRQDAESLNSAIKLVESDFRAKLINYNDNPVDKWCFSNSCLQINTRRQALIIKNKQSEKIDGAVALASLYEMYRRYRTDLRKVIGG